MTTATLPAEAASRLMEEARRFLDQGHVVAATATARSHLESVLRCSLGKPNDRSAAGQLASDAYRAGRIRRSTCKKVQQIAAHLSVSVHGTRVPIEEVNYTLQAAEELLRRLIDELATT